MSAKKRAAPAVPPWRRWLVAPVVALVLGWVIALVPPWIGPARPDGGEPVFEFLATLLAVLVLAPAVAILGSVTTFVARTADSARGRTAVRVLGGLTWILAVGPALVLGAWFNQDAWGVWGLIAYAAVWMFVLLRILRFAAGYTPDA